MVIITPWGELIPVTSIWAVSFIPFKTACRKPQVPRGLPQSFRDHSRSFRGCFLLKIASASFRLWYFFQYRFREHSASFREACRNRICWFWSQLKHRWFTEKHYYFRSKSFGHMQIKRGFSGTSKSQNSHIWHVANTLDKDATPSAELPRIFRRASANFLQRNGRFL